MRPSELLEAKREVVREIFSRHPLVRNPRVFGSVAAGTDTPGSDIDFLVESLPGIDLFEMGGLFDELQQVLGESIDLCTEKELPVSWRQTVLDQAVPL